VPSGPQVIGGRFDRGLRRLEREQTSLLSWLAESDTTEVLRTDSKVDLREDEVVDLRAGGDDTVADAPAHPAAPQSGR
jgi:hypothetical protein